MYTRLKKLVNNPFLYLFSALKILFTVCKYPINFVLFRKIGVLSYVSLRSSVRSHRCISLANHVEINPFVVLWPTSLSIGPYSQLNPGTAVYGDVVIGAYVMIAPNCMIVGGNHNFSGMEQPMIFQGSNSKGIVIEDDVWLGANVTVLDGITIGKGSIIAAGSVVTKNVEPYSIMAGVPARKINSRADQPGYKVA